MFSEEENEEKKKTKEKKTSDFVNTTKSLCLSRALPLYESKEREVRISLY